MTKTLPLALVAALSLAGAASAQTAQSGAYTLETTHAEVVFGVSHLGFSTYYGQFPGATGTLKLDGANPANSQLDVSIPVSGVMTASTKLNEELTSAVWMDAGKYPTMIFHSTKIVPTGPDTADVMGDFTMHGVTKPLTLKATFKKAGPYPMGSHPYTVGFEVMGTIHRSEFGFDHFVPMIGDDVKVMISAPFQKAGA